MNSQIRPLILLAAFALGLSACTQTISDLENDHSNLRETKSLSLNYQQLHERVFDTARQCLNGVVGSGLSTVDEEIQTDQGQTKIAHRLKSAGIETYTWLAIIERIDAFSSKITVISGTAFNNQATIDRVLSWTSGSTRCD